jgi:hypothetical protein
MRTRLPTSRAAELEALRILDEYRRLVLLGRARLSFAEARKLVGPDCAFHLYFRHAQTRPPTHAGGPPRRRGGPEPRPKRRRRRA